MNDADELARRYLGLWTQYLTALLADPRAMEMLKRWIALADQFSYPAAGTAEAGGAPSPVWPPIFGSFGLPFSSATADASVGRREEVTELTRRVDELERRLAALEHKPKPRRSRRSGPA